MAVAAGDLDTRIMIQTDTVTRDRANDEVHAWADSFRLWSKRRQNQGYETQGAQELVRSADTVFEVRDRTKAQSIKPETHRIVVDGAIFTIVGIQKSVEKNDTLKILASSRPDGRGARGQGQTDGP